MIMNIRAVLKNSIHQFWMDFHFNSEDRFNNRLTFSLWSWTCRDWEIPICALKGFHSARTL